MSNARKTSPEGHGTKVIGWQTGSCSDGHPNINLHTSEHEDFTFTISTWDALTLAFNLADTAIKANDKSADPDESVTSFAGDFRELIAGVATALDSSYVVGDADYLK